VWYLEYGGGAVVGMGLGLGYGGVCVVYVCMGEGVWCGTLSMEVCMGEGVWCGTLSMEVVRSLGWDSGLGMEVCVWCMCVCGGVCALVP
jgi:hypothetical protein